MSDVIQRHFAVRQQILMLVATSVEVFLNCMLVPGCGCCLHVQIAAFGDLTCFMNLLERSLSLCSSIFEALCNRCKWLCVTFASKRDCATCHET